MARNTSLYLRLGEGKDLPAKDINGKSDPYCVIKVDNEEVARTSTQWRTLNPFWGEEYILHLPLGFHNLTLYVFDQDFMRLDESIGKVMLTRETLMNYPKGLEKWWGLTRVDKDTEVQGEVHLEVGRYNCDGKHFVKVNILSARDLAAKDSSGTADPYVKVSFHDFHQETRKIEKTRFPTWNVECSFDVDALAGAKDKVKVEVWDWDRLGEDDFMGQVEFPLSTLSVNSTVRQWFRLSPRCSHKDEENSKLGSLRVKVRLMEERILPSEYYKPLIDLLINSTNITQDVSEYPTPLIMLDEVATLDMLDIANTLVRLYLGQGKIVAYLQVICAHEIQKTKDPNTLFRGNSLATKSMDQFMKIVGLPYLLETLGPIIDQMYEEHKIIELDPSKICTIKRRYSLINQRQPDREIIEQSADTLRGYITDMISRIMNSVTRCPSVMRLVFQRLMSSVIDKWPEEEWRDHRFLSVSGFLFLRFFAPAVLSPKLFAMRDAHPDARLSRSLTLAAKVIQSIGNLGVQIGPAKEKWMEPLHDFIKLCVPDVKEYLQRVCEVDGKAEHITGLYRRRSTFHPSVIMKEGYLEKYRDGVKSNKSKNLLKIFKQRYFWLKYESLTYTHKSSDQVRNTISTCNIVGVEKVDKNAFGKNHIGQIIYRNSDDDAQYAQGKQGPRSDCKKTAELFETLYFQAKNVNDLSSWISSIRKTCITNTFLLEYYHPGAFSGNKWTCCLTKLKAADGCCRTHCKATLGDWRDPLDPDVDAQLVYSQLQRAADVFRKKYTETAIEVTEDTQYMSQNSECVSRDTQHVSQETECVSRDSKDMSRETDTTNANISNTENANAGNANAESANAENANAENANASHAVLTNSQRDILLGRSISYKDAQMGAVAELLDVISDLEKIHQIFERKEMEEKEKVFKLANTCIP